MTLEALLKLKDSVADIGRQLATEGLESGSKESDSFFEAVMGLLMVKKALEKIYNERNSETLFGESLGIDVPYHSGNSETISAGRGVDGGDAGSLHVPGETQAHGAEPPK